MHAKIGRSTWDMEGVSRLGSLRVKRGKQPQHPPLLCLAGWVWMLGSRLRTQLLSVHDGTPQGGFAGWQRTESQNL